MAREPKWLLRRSEEREREQRRAEEGKGEVGWEVTRHPPAPHSVRATLGGADKMGSSLRALAEID